MKRLHTLLAFSLAGSIGLIGCSGDDGNNSNNVDPPTDSGVSNNNTNNNNNPDAGGNNNNNNDTDSGVIVPPDPCPDGTEGCECTSNIGPDDMAFLQDDCEAGMLCVPFDLITGRNDLTGPVQSCVRTCTTDTDCGAGQSCVASGYGEETGAANICVDRVAGFDEACGYSRGLTSRAPDVTLNTGGEIVGCQAGYDCFIGTFNDLHPDEGLCLALCEGDDECPTDTPYCNPDVFSRTSTSGETIGIGACNVAKIGQGGICGSTNPEKFGFLAGCDNSSDTPDGTVCVPIGGLTPDGQGICMTPCMDATECGTEPNGDAQVCSSGFFTSGAGVCSSGCTNYPDTCAGDGENGVGRFCMAYLADEDSNPVGVCMDRREPALIPATVDSAGNVTQPGDNCFAPGGSLAFTQCPNPGHCEIVDFQQGVGICVFGCATADVTGPTSCPDVLGSVTATCAQVFQQGGEPVTDIGLCGDN